MSGETSEDWRMCTDRKTGRTYFYNKKTQVSQWTKPPEWKLDPLNNPAKWKEAVDPQSGLPYWSNAAAGKSTFVKPACLSPPSLGPSEEEVKAAWKEAKDPKSGTIYWLNTITKEASWDNPLGPPGESVKLEGFKPERGSKPEGGTLKSEGSFKLEGSFKPEGGEGGARPPEINTRYVAAPESPEVVVAPRTVLLKQQQPSSPEVVVGPKAMLRQSPSRQLEQQTRAFELKEREWEQERASLLKRQQELEAEVAALRAQNANGNDNNNGTEGVVSLAQLQQDMLAKFTLLDLQNQQVIALLQQQHRPTLRERAH